MNGLLVRKPLELLIAESADEREHALKRVLGPWALSVLGIGAIIGAGIFVLTGAAVASPAALFPGGVLSGIASK